MRSSGIVSNVTSAEMARIVAALTANLPPPEEIKPKTRVFTLCRHAKDTGEIAFPAAPCRGSRIECKKTGVWSFAAACRSDKCKFYEEENPNEDLLLQP